jgi:hypothetical protein
VNGQFCKASPFDCLTELERHAGELSADPQDWMPWDYRETLEKIRNTARRNAVQSRRARHSIL